MAPSTGMVPESVIDTANALIARGVPATRALEMAQETASNWFSFSSYATGIPPLEVLYKRANRSYAGTLFSRPADARCGTLTLSGVKLGREWLPSSRVIVEKRAILKSDVPTSAMMMTDQVQNKKPPTVPLRLLKSEKETHNPMSETDLVQRKPLIEPQLMQKHRNKPVIQMPERQKIDLARLFVMAKAA